MAFGPFPDNGLFARTKGYIGGVAMIAAGLVVTYLVSTILQQRADLQNERAATHRADEVNPPAEGRR
jgi:hypothetical protein